ncbi:uncharacterized protein [Haliotis cracherodii]|uniref:uncharacterized protein n=1 Tax=Haliotis cracherodii TaxID=6455 RepID=UPI0039EA60C4
MSGTADVESLFDRFWQWRQEDSPEFASYCGNHDYDDRWDDISEDAYLKRETKVREFLSEAEALDASSCCQVTKDSLALLTEDLTTYLNGAKFKCYLLPVNFMEGIHNDLVHLIEYHGFDSQEGFTKYLARLKALPHRILQMIPVLKQGIKEGLTMHKHALAVVPGQLETMLTEPVEDSLLMAPLLKSGGPLSTDELDTMKKQVEMELTTNIRPSLEKLKDFIVNEYMHHLRPAEGVCTLKNGASYYQMCLNFHMSCDMSPQEVHDLGLKEVARIRKQMLEISAKEGFGQDLKAFQKKLHTSKEFSFNSKDEVMDYVKDICFNQIRPKLHSVFHTLPDIPLVLKHTPASQANAPAGFYSAGTADKTRPGIYSINANNLDSCKKYEFMALSLHEGEPGHHLQHSLSVATAVPLFRQYIEDSKYYLAPGRFPMHTAYIEGWGLYSEALGLELGMYTDNYSMFGRYSFEMLRAARLVVDTGLHSMGWTQAKAVEYLVDCTLTDEWSMRNEVNRYITMPGQACAYKIGELKLWELRHKAEKELGDLFDVRDYHAAVLQCGPVPLTFLEAAIDEYISTTKANQGSPSKKAKAK